MKEFHLCKLHNEAFEMAETRINAECFLPIREGVSKKCAEEILKKWFPPYTGGCIVEIINCFVLAGVSSLYGRVYRIRPVWSSNWTSFLPVWEGVSENFGLVQFGETFPPCMGGCIVTNISIKDATKVSSLYGRVYRIHENKDRATGCFLPVREGVSPKRTADMVNYRQTTTSAAASARP